jgi:hypothetical protein
MKIEDISKLWSEDSYINESMLVSESSKIPKLHHKYYTVLMDERLLLLKLKSRHDELAVVLEGFFLKTLTGDELNQWGLVYSDKKVLRTDVPRHVETHSMLVELKLKIGVQNEKVKFLEDIIKMIHAMNFTMKNIIDSKKFLAGN